MGDRKPTVPEVLERFRAYREKTNGLWGSLHIVLSDNNIEDHWVAECVQTAEERGDVEGAELARILLSMSRTQRLKLGDFRTYQTLSGKPHA